MPPCWRQPLLASRCCTCAVTTFGVGSAPSSCSLDALFAMSMRCAPCLLGWRQPLLASRCCTCVQSQSSASALLRRRARSMRCAPCRCAVRHTPGLASAASRVAVPHLRAVTLSGAGFAPTPCPLDAGGATPFCWRPPLLAALCCTYMQSLSTAAGLPHRRARWLAAIWALAGCPLLDSSVTVSRTRLGVTAISHLTTRVAIDVHSAPRARVTQLSTRRFPLTRNADVELVCFLLLRVRWGTFSAACWSALNRVLMWWGMVHAGSSAAAAVLLAPSA